MAIPWRKMLLEQDSVHPEVVAHQYPGNGTEDNPFVVSFLDSDPRDPMQFSRRLRWMLCLAAAYATFSVAFLSSAYASGIPDISRDLEGSTETVTLGLSLFLLGFVLGPLVWAPSSELFGRQRVLVFSITVHVLFNIAMCFSHSLVTLLLLRFLSGAFGAAPLSNSGAVIADTFPPKERGLAITVYALLPLFAPLLGPIVGEYVTGAYGWRWLMRMMAILSASALLVTLICLPETYAPVLLDKRAKRLSQLTGRQYVSEPAKGPSSSGSQKPLSGAILRPFVLAANEPILLLIAIYQAIVFGTLYLTFTAFPTVYTQLRGWPQERSGLSFLGVLAGFFLSVIFQLWDNRRYVQLVDRLGTSVTPEARLPGSCIGGVCIVLGLFLFAWTANPNIPWIINTAAGAPFGFGVVLVTISSTNYLVDVYNVFAASALTVCICARAICGAAFPVFVPQLFARLGVYWGLSLPGLFALLCAPVPFVFYHYGTLLRRERTLSPQGPVTERTGLLSTA